MSKELKVRPSPMLVLCYVAIAVCILGFLGCSVLGLVDFRSEEQKEIDYRNKLIEHSLFEDAKEMAQDIIEKPGTTLYKSNIKRISCLKIKADGNIHKYILVEVKNSDEFFCYNISTSIRKRLYSNVYDSLKNQYFVISELVLEDNDLEILFEEAEKK